MFTAIVMPLTPLAWWLTTTYNERWTACTAAHPRAADQPFTGPCTGSFTITGLASLVLLVLPVATVVGGLVVGVVEGRRRRRFAQGRWICALVVALTGPWAMAAYAIGYGLGRLIPPPRPGAVAVAHQHGWQTAARLYADLAGGQPLPRVLAPGFLDTEPVHFDAPLAYSRYYGMDVRYQPGASVAVGSPTFVTGVAIGSLIGQGIGHARAASLSRSQWREHRTVRVVVTTSRTWCCVDGRWLAFDHAAVMGYHLDGAGCVLTFADVEPLRLAGPSAACHAVVFAYLRGGATWQHQPFLQPIAAAATAVAPAPPA